MYGPGIHGKRFVNEGGWERTSPQEDGLEPAQVCTLSQQPRELGRDEGDVRGAEAGDGFGEWISWLWKRDRCPCEQAAEEDRKSPDVVQRQRVEPSVAGTERDIGVRAEGAVVVVAEGVDRRLRHTGAPRGKDNCRRTLLRNIRRLRTLLAPSEQGFGLWPSQASSSCLQKFLVFGDQGRAGRLPEEPRDALWW